MAQIINKKADNMKDVDLKTLILAQKINIGEYGITEDCSEINKITKFDLYVDRENKTYKAKFALFVNGEKASKVFKNVSMFIYSGNKNIAGKDSKEIKGNLIEDEENSVYEFDINTNDDLFETLQDGRKEMTYIIRGYTDTIGNNIIATVGSIYQLDYDSYFIGAIDGKNII